MNAKHLILLLLVPTVFLLQNQSAEKSKQKAIEVEQAEKNEKVRIHQYWLDKANNLTIGQINVQCRVNDLEDSLCQEMKDNAEYTEQALEERRSVAVEKYSFEDREDTSLATMQRGRIKLKIPNDYVPTESEIRSIALDAWDKYSGQWKNGHVYIYVKNMPINDAAYASVEFNNATLARIIIQ